MKLIFNKKDKRLNPFEGNNYVQFRIKKIIYEKMG